MSSKNIDLAIKIQASRLKELLKWRKHLRILIEATRKVFGSNAEVYVYDWIGCFEEHDCS